MNKFILACALMLATAVTTDNLRTTFATGASTTILNHLLDQEITIRMQSSNQILQSTASTPTHGAGNANAGTEGGWWD